MKASIILICFFLTVCCFSARAQEKNITGTVTSQNDGMPIPGVNVVIKGTSTGTATDFNGNYSIQANPGDVLVFSYLGLETQEVAVSNQNSINVTMATSAAALEKVVLIGYGQAEKKDLTGSITSIEPESITNQPAASAMESIQGKAAGVIITPSGAPGAAPDVFIRGLGTVFGGQNPLYVVDGVLTDGIRNINPNDILSMDILKDASSLAIYGNRGANGVIIVTTKKGKAGKMKISYDGFSGFTTVLNHVEMADARSYAIYSNEGLGLERFSENPQYNTDWYDEIMRTGVFRSHNVAISTGGKNITAYFSAGFFEEEGILKGNDYNKLTLRSNTTFDLADNVTFTSAVSAALVDEVPKPFSIFTTAYKQSPLVPVRYTSGPFDGKFGVSTDEQGDYNNVGNPVRDLLFNNQKQDNLKLQGSFTFEYEIADWISFTSRFGVETSYFRSKSFVPNLKFFLSDDPSKTREDYTDETINTLTITKRDNYSWVLDNFINLTHTFGEVHNFDLTLGTSAEEMGGSFLTGVRENVPENPDYWSLNNGSPEPAFARHLEDPTVRLRSYFARLSYDFDGRYLFTGTLRRDGSSQFQEGEKYGNFFAVGVGWVVSEEAFLEDSEVINYLKFRASFGELGNQNVPLNILTFTTDLNYVFGPDQHIVEGGTIDELIDPELSWETTEALDIGVDFGFLENKLTGTVDYYNRLNRDATLPVELPDAFGFSGVTLTPAGQVRNKGWEFSLNWNGKIGDDFNYTIGANFTMNENELENISNPFFAENRGGSIGGAGRITKKVVEGQPLGSFWLLQVTGVDDEGNFTFEDLNDDGEINDDDKQFYGSYAPQNYFGINIGITYRNWDFNVDGFGNYGNKVYNGKKAQRFGLENIEQAVFDNRWTPENTSNTEPAPYNTFPRSSTYFLESGDFFRINNITVGYTIPFNKNSFFEEVRIYATAQNPFIWQDYSGFTPELPGAPLGLAGIELSAYPSVTKYLVGLNISI